MALVNIVVGDGRLEASIEGRSLLVASQPDKGDRRSFTVWGSDSDGVVYESGINEWFSDALGVDCQLVYMPDDAGRPVSEKYNRGGEKVSFADGYPLLVIGERSLADLNQRLASGTLAVQSGPLPMNRFRPNIVVSGSEAFAEDCWHRLRVGEAIFRVVKPCARCVMTTVDQARGEFDGKEPLKTMATFRMAKQAFPDTFESFGHAPNSVLFGENLIPENPGVNINVGDEVEVLEFRSIYGD